MPSPLPTPPASSGTPARRGTRAAGRRASRGLEGPGALQTVEEAFQLLRVAPLSTLWLYYLGAVPFVLAAFYFWADMSRSSHAGREAAAASLGLAAAYLWMKGWQAGFCRKLWQQLHPSGRLAGFRPGTGFRAFAALAFLQALAWPARLLAFPFAGWTIPFFQSAAALAFAKDHAGRPLRDIAGLAARGARDHWARNHLILLIMAALGLFVWLNVFGAAILLPMALRMFFGVETAFTLNPESTLLNSSFLFATLLLAYLALDPLLKAIATLDGFRLLSRASGSDLLSRLDHAAGQSRRRPGGAGASRLPAALAWLAGGALLLGGPAPLPAQEDAAGPDPPSLGTPVASPEALGRSIEEVLRGKEYQWRLPRQDMGAGKDGERGWLEGMMTDLADSVERAVKRLWEAAGKLARRLFEGRGSPGHGPDLSGAGAGIGAAAKAAFLLAAAGLAAWVAWLLLRSRSRRRPGGGDEGAAATLVDLESESIVATELPEEEWMRLAREQIERGEHRLAVRALFLASLSHLGERGLLRVARFKSNRDYSRELRLKARAWPGLIAAFGENVGLFERAWYGLHEIGRDGVDRFTANHERITRAPASAPVPAGPPLPSA